MEIKRIERIKEHIRGDLNNIVNEYSDEEEENLDVWKLIREIVEE